MIGFLPSRTGQYLPLEFIRGEDVTELLPDSTLLSVLYPSNKQLSPRVRVSVDWLVESIGSRFHQSADERPYAGAKAR